jgi:aldehyde dehydrogenase (NAD+)
MQPDGARALNIIAGKAVPANDGATFERRSPLDGSLVAFAPRSRSTDIQAAVTAAKAAWRPWSQRSAVQRGDLLRRFATVLEDGAEELIAAVRAETGKPRRDLQGELGAAQELAYFMASEGRRFYGRTMPSSVPGKHVSTERAPIGVAALIVAANTPLPNYAWKVLPALLCGNTVVLKPSEHTPLSAQLFVEGLHSAGVPDGVVNLVHGLGDEAGRALVDHPDVDLVSFTGGTEVGRDIARRAGGRLAKTCLELGGKNPLVVCDDADLDRAARAAVASAFSNAGQRCAAGSRIIVDERVLAAFLDRFLPLVEELVVGAGDTADVGPVISEAQLEGILERVHEARGAGAKVLAGGERLTDPARAPGTYMSPTVLLAARGGDDPIAMEVFGPVTCIHVVADFDEALAKADDTTYGLTAAVHTRDMNRARAFVDHVQAGMVTINGPTYGSEPHTPFGGFRASGNGCREGGTEVLDFYSDWKAVHAWTNAQS